MRVSAVLGFVVALLIGTVALGFLVITLSSQPPIVATLVPQQTPAAITTLPPTPTPVQTAVSSSPSPSPSPNESSLPVGTAVGQKAPPFELPTLDGGKIGTAASASAGKPLWVNFMATWCPQCQDELPMMQGMKLQIGDAMDIVLVDVGEDPATVSAFLTQLDVTLPLGLDQDGTVQAQWEALALPVHFWLDTNGVVQEVVYGGAPTSVFQDAVHTVLPEVSFSPAPGASP
jgi:cytochrome c biogenesis protein CcmG, thiol:disulfide interchange protein DsbE